MTRRTWDESDPGAPPMDDIDALVQDFRGELRGLNRSLRRAVRLEWLRFRTRAVDAGLLGALYCGMVGFLLALLLSGGVFIAQGIRDSLGNLGAGFAILGGILAAGLVLRFVVRRQGVQKAKRAFEEDET